MRLVLAVSACLILSATPAIAKDKADTPADPDKKICRTLEETGSILPKRVCHTAAEWKSIDTANERSAQNFEDGRDKSRGTR